MPVIAGIGVEITPTEVRAVAVGPDGAVVGRQQSAGVATAGDLRATLGRLADALGGPAVPIALAWHGGACTTAVDLTPARPVELAARLQRWATGGVDEITVVVDADGGHWGVGLGPARRVGDAVRRAAEQAGLSVVGCEPIALARARRAGTPPAESMAAVAAGSLAPSATVTMPGLAPVRDDDVWVIERQRDEQPEPAPRRRARRWPTWVDALRRAVAPSRRTRQRD